MTARLTALMTIALLACAPRMVAPRCGFSDFAPARYDHLIEQVSATTLPEFAGRLSVSSNDVPGGVWPAGLDARIELHGPDGLLEFVDAGDDGTFMRRDLEPGTYCFKLSASGFRSVLGTVVIDPARQESSRLEIQLEISE